MIDKKHINSTVSASQKEEERWNEEGKQEEDGVRLMRPLESRFLANPFTMVVQASQIEAKMRPLFHVPSNVGEIYQRGVPCSYNPWTITRKSTSILILSLDSSSAACKSESRFSLLRDELPNFSSEGDNT